MSRTLIVLFAFLAATSFAVAQSGLPKGFAIEPQTSSLSASGILRSNTINVLTQSGDTLWVGSGKGLSATYDGGISWRHYEDEDYRLGQSVSAIAVRNDVVWVAFASSVEIDGQQYPSGAGMAYSTDRGSTWSFLPQPTDAGLVDTLVYGINRIKTLAITTTVNNITYDIALTSSGVWIASFAGMLRHSNDFGSTWQRTILPPDNKDSIAPDDSLDFDYAPTGGRAGLRGNLNHRLFSVYAANDSTIWVGTAGGINVSADNGVRWKKFSFQNQSSPISGNFVVAITQQIANNGSIIWASTRDAEDPNERRGISYSTDSGATWNTTLGGVFAQNIAAKDPDVYVASDKGFFRTTDNGSTWQKAGLIFDPITLHRFTDEEVVAVATIGDSIWTGGSEGLAMTIEKLGVAFGSEWKIIRSYQPVTRLSETYSYPLPFSPSFEVVRIHYPAQTLLNEVTIRIFNFAMQPVKTLIRSAQRSGPAEYDEIWNGRDDRGEIVANGIYFYSVEVNDSKPEWGKIFVLR